MKTSVLVIFLSTLITGVCSAATDCKTDLVSRTKNELATFVVVSSGFDDMFKQQIAFMLSNTQPAINKWIMDSRNVKNKSAGIAVMSANIAATFSTSEAKDRFFALGVKAHEDYFDKQELCVLLSFNNSVIGKKSLDFQSKQMAGVMAQSALIGQQLMQEAQLMGIESLRRSGDWVD